MQSADECRIAALVVLRTGYAIYRMSRKALTTSKPAAFRSGLSGQIVAGTFAVQGTFPRERYAE